RRTPASDTCPTTGSVSAGPGPTVKVPVNTVSPSTSRRITTPGCNHSVPCCPCTEAAPAHPASTSSVARSTVVMYSFHGHALRRGVAFGSDVGDLFPLGPAFERHREVDAPAQLQRVAGVPIALVQRLDLGLQLQCAGHEHRELLQLLDLPPALCGPEGAPPPQ